MHSKLEDIEATLAPAHQLAIAQQICSGMEVLASHSLIHRDLALRNILLFAYDARNVSVTSVKVADFGLTVNAYTATAKYVQDGPKPIRWMAPEALQRGRYSEKSDVWSFAVTVRELLTLGEIPYCAMTSDDTVTAFVIGGGVLEAPTCSAILIWDAVRGCFSKAPSERPTFALLSVTLGQINMQQQEVQGSERVPDLLQKMQEEKNALAKAQQDFEAERALGVQKIQEEKKALAKARQEVEAERVRLSVEKIKIEQLPALKERDHQQQPKAPSKAVLSVSNAGESFVNGFYEQNGEFNSKPQYRKVSLSFA